MRFGLSLCLCQNIFWSRILNKFLHYEEVFSPSFLISLMKSGVSPPYHLTWRSCGWCYQLSFWDPSGASELGHPSTHWCNWRTASIYKPWGPTHHTVSCGSTKAGKSTLTFICQGMSFWRCAISEGKDSPLMWKRCFPTEVTNSQLLGSSGSAPLPIFQNIYFCVCSHL